MESENLKSNSPLVNSQPVIENNDGSDVFPRSFYKFEITYFIQQLKLPNRFQKSLIASLN